MDLDMHCHAKLSKKNPFNLRHFQKMQNCALRNGLQAIALTEHFNTPGFAEIHECLKEHYPYREDYYDAGGLKVFCGLEVDIKEGGHVLLIGKREDVLELQAELITSLLTEGFPSLEWLAKEADKRDMLKICAHPYRKEHNLSGLSEERFKQFDFLELNGKDYKKEEQVRRLAASLRMKVVAGSDTHHWMQVGCVRNRLAQDCTTVSQLKRSLSRGNYETVISPIIGLKLSGARLAKKILKKYLELEPCMK